MNVWIQYLYWTDEYPKGPDDPRCSKFQDPDSEAEHIPITFNHEATGDIESLKKIIEKKRQNKRSIRLQSP